MVHHDRRPMACGVDLELRSNGDSSRGWNYETADLTDVVTNDNSEKMVAWNLLT